MINKLRLLILPMNDLILLWSRLNMSRTIVDAKMK